MDGLRRGNENKEQLSIPEAMRVAVEWHREGLVRNAAEVYRRILSLDPDYPDALHFLGVALHQLGRSADGAALLRRTLELSPGYAEAVNNLGNLLKETGDLAGAEAAYRQALLLNADAPDTLNNLGIILKERGLLDDAVTTFQRALDHNPRHADLWHNLGNTLKKLGRIDEALTAYRQAIILKPYHTEAYRNLGRMLYITGRSDEAAEVYRQWLASAPDNPVARHLLAACSRMDVPERASDAYVATSFDSFAASFDNVMARLNYRAPALVLDAVRQIVGEPAGVLRVLDAGCGTGICGSLLRPYAGHLTGVDLSRGMLNRAGGRGVYDDLVQDELTAYLARQQQWFDLIVSVDTLCYFGELGLAINAAAGALRPGGWLVFTLEAGEDDAGGSYVLQPHGRYNHTAGYVCQALGEAELEVVSIGRDFLRSEGGQAVAGLVVVARCVT